MELLELKELLGVITTVCAKCPIAAAAMVIPFYCSLRYLNTVVLQDKAWAKQALYILMVISICVLVSLTVIIAAGKL